MTRGVGACARMASPVAVTVETLLIHHDVSGATMAQLYRLQSSVHQAQQPSRSAGVQTNQ